VKIVTVFTTVYDTDTKRVETYNEIYESLDGNKRKPRFLTPEKSVSDMVKEIAEGEGDA
jgi:hypothetical protein